MLVHCFDDIFVLMFDSKMILFFIQSPYPFIMPKLKFLELRLIKETKTFRIKPDNARRLERAAAQAGMSQSIYLKQTLEARFRRERLA